MFPLTLRELVHTVQGEIVLGDPKQIVYGVSLDSRHIEQGKYFLALKGKNFDGHNFISTALGKGAGGVILERLPENFPGFQLTSQGVIRVKDTLYSLGDLAGYLRRESKALVVGITGSNGKTTTKEMLGGILQGVGNTLISPENQNNQIGVPQLFLHLTDKHRYVVAELGTSACGEIAYLARIVRPQVAVITNIGKAHLEGLKNPRSIREEKLSLAQELVKEGKLVINADDSLLAEVLPELRKNYQVVDFSLEKPASVFADGIHLWPPPIGFHLHLGKDVLKINLNILGKFNIYNALAAAAAAWSLSIEPSVIKKSLEIYRPYPQRMEIISPRPGLMFINDTYNANPSSCRAALEAFVQFFPDREKIVIIGEMAELGEESKKEHYELGKFLATLPLEKIFLYGESTRFTKQGLLEQMFNPENVFHFLQAEELIGEIQPFLQRNVALFFKASRIVRLEEVLQRLLSIFHGGRD